MERKKVAAYCRVSTDSADQENSFENQQTLFIDRAKEQNCDLVRIYTDKGISGTTLDRDGFNRLLTDAGLRVIRVSKGYKGSKKEHLNYEIDDTKSPMFNEIWMKNTSRMARTIEVINIVKLLKSINVNLFFYDLGLNTKDSGSEYTLNILATMDEHESTSKSLKVLTGKRESRKKGSMSSNSKLYGYLYITGKHKGRDSHLEIIPEEAVVVKRIFELYSQGIGVRRIINILTDEGVLTRQSKPFGPSTIRRILDQEKYYGCNNSAKWTSGLIFQKHSPRIRAEREYDPSNIVEDRIPPIITKELFDKCHDLRMGKINHKLSIGVKTGTTKYSGLLYCSKCGSKYVANKDKGRSFYNCQTKRIFGTTACDSANVQMYELDELFKVINENTEKKQESIEITRKIAAGYLFVQIELLLLEMDTDKSILAEEARIKFNQLQTNIDDLTDLLMSASEYQKANLKKKIEGVFEEQEKERIKYEEAIKGNTPIIEKIGRSKEILNKIWDLDLISFGEKVFTTEDVERIIVDPSFGKPGKDGERKLLIPMSYEISGGRQFSVVINSFEEISEIVGSEWMNPIHGEDIYTALKQEDRYNHSETFYIDSMSEDAGEIEYKDSFLVLTDDQKNTLDKQCAELLEGWKSMNQV